MPRYSCNLVRAQPVKDNNGKFTSESQCEKYCWTQHLPPELNRIVLDYVPEHIQFMGKNEMLRYIKSIVGKELYEHIPDKDIEEVYNIFLSSDDVKAIYPDNHLFLQGIMGKNSMPPTKVEMVKPLHKLIKFPSLHKYYFSKWPGYFMDCEIYVLTKMHDWVNWYLKAIPKPIEETFNLVVKTTKEFVEFLRRGMPDTWSCCSEDNFPFQTTFNREYNWNVVGFLRSLGDINIYYAIVKVFPKFDIWLIQKIILNNANLSLAHKNIIRNLKFAKGDAWVIYMAWGYYRIISQEFPPEELYEAIDNENIDEIKRIYDTNQGLCDSRVYSRYKYMEILMT